MIYFFKMALRGLVEGDCGGANPLVRLTSHLTNDNAHLEDGLVRSIRGQNVSGIPEQGLVREFLSETHEVASRAARPPQTFRMDSLLREMTDIEASRSRGAVPKQAPKVAHLAVESDPVDMWAREYLDTDQNVIDWSREYMARHGMAGPDPLYDVDSGIGFSEASKWSDDYLNSNSAFSEAPKWADEYLSDVPLIKDSELATLGDFNVGDEPKLDPKEFEAFVASVRKETKTKTPAKYSSAIDAAWAEEFAEFTQSDVVADIEGHQSGAENNTYKEEFWKNLENEWKDAAENEDHPWLSDFSAQYEPFKEYDFREDNPLQNIPNSLEEGRKRLASGDIPGAVLLFEAAVKKEPQNSLAWQLLGTSQSENEQDPQAIAALKQCINLDPSNQVALMTLAASYTNESYQAQACWVLKQWIKNNPEYGHLAHLDTNAEHFNMASSFMSEDLHKATTSMYLQAARMRQQGSIDPDVQAGLGVLFNLSGEFDKAVDCFQSAVASRPMDALLWNRLGATLANGDRSEEAVSAYHTALRYRPGNVRSRYNLGVACINLKAYKEAAQHFLTALKFQASGRGPQDSQSPNSMSSSIWTSLRMATSLLKRTDLLPAIDAKDLDNLCKQFNVAMSS